MSTATPTLPKNALFGRSIKLILLDNNSNALDLSQLHITFSVRAADNETPNTAIIRVYNASTQTMKQAINQYSYVSLEAGYIGDNLSGVIFQGQIKQVRVGKEANIDRYIEFAAADSFEAYNFGTVNQTLPAGSTMRQEVGVVAQSMGLSVGILPDVVDGFVNLRPKVLWGMGKLYMQGIAATLGCRWSIQKGAITLIPLNSYLPGVIVQLDPTSGLIGVPEANDGGLHFRCLLNPKLNIGNLVHLSAWDINQTVIEDQGLTVAGTATTLVPTDIGTYRIMVIEYSGDTRGDDWYCECIALTVDLTTNTVSAFNQQ